MAELVLARKSTFADKVEGRSNLGGCDENAFRVS